MLPDLSDNKKGGAVVGKAIKDTQASSFFLSFSLFCGYLGGSNYGCGCNLKLQTLQAGDQTSRLLHHKYCLVIVGLFGSHRSIIKSNGKGLGILVGGFLWIIEVLLQSTHCSISMKPSWLCVFPNSNHSKYNLVWNLQNLD